MRKNIFSIIIFILALNLIFTPVITRADSGISEAAQEIIEKIEAGDYSEENIKSDEQSKNENQPKNEVQAEKDSPDSQENTAADKKEKSSENPYKGPAVSTVFFNTDIREALNELSLQTGVNIIYDETVVGTVTLDLKNVPLEKALEMMLVSGGYTYNKVDDYYLVGLPTPNSPMFDKLTTTETIKLNYITASEAEALLPSFYSPYLSMSSGDNDQLLSVTAPDEIIEDLKVDLKEIDNAPKEVVVEIIVTEVSREVINEYGADLFGITDNQDLEGYELDDGGLLEFDGSSFFAEAAGSDGSLITELRALEEEEKAEIKANPKIRISDGESANLFVGEERVLILEREDADDVLEEVEVGVSMEVTPQIMAENEIKMNISPEVSNFSEEQDQQLIVRRSQLESVVRAESGETITMAGMTLNEVMNYESAVPILGNIPLLRWMFREETNSTGDRELLVLITPKIVNM